MKPDMTRTLEIKIEIKREEGERIEKEEENHGVGGRTGFEEVKEEKCGLCVKASEVKMALKERVKRTEAELRETNAELRRRRWRLSR